METGRAHAHIFIAAAGRCCVTKCRWRLRVNERRPRQHPQTGPRWCTAERASCQLLLGNGCSSTSITEQLSLQRRSVTAWCSNLRVGGRVAACVSAAADHGVACWADAAPCHACVRDTEATHRRRGSPHASRTLRTCW